MTVKKENLLFLYMYKKFFYKKIFLYSGKSMVKEIQGFYCERCRRFMLLGEDMNAHLRSITHYRSFVAEVRSLTSTSPSKVTPTTESKETKEADVSNYVS